MDKTKENRVFILDADNEQIFKTDIYGNIISVMDLSSMLYLTDPKAAPISTSFLNKDGAASPVWCTTDRNGNAYVTLADNISAIKINYETDIVIQIYTPPFKNLELYDSSLYPKIPKSQISTIDNLKTMH